VCQAEESKEDTRDRDELVMDIEAVRNSLRQAKDELPKKYPGLKFSTITTKRHHVNWNGSYWYDITCVLSMPKRFSISYKYRIYSNRGSDHFVYVRKCTPKGGYTSNLGLRGFQCPDFNSKVKPYKILDYILNQCKKIKEVTIVRNRHAFKPRCFLNPEPSIRNNAYYAQSSIGRVEIEVVALNPKTGKVSYDKGALSDPNNGLEPWYKCFISWIRWQTHPVNDSYPWVEEKFILYDGESYFYPFHTKILEKDTAFTKWCHHLTIDDKKVLDMAISELVNGAKNVTG